MFKFFIKIITKILSTNFFAKIIFDVDCSKAKLDYQIGFSTLLLKKALKKYIKDKDRILDIGTGAFAIHSIWLKKNFDVDVTSTEIEDSFLDSARKVIMNNKVKVELIKSDLFNNIKRKFDWALFNPPFGNREDKNGFKIVERLLIEAPKKIKLMIVVNAYYVNQRKIEKIIRNNKYKILEIVTKNFNPAKVFVIER